MQRLKKLVAAALSAVLVVSGVPAAAVAEEATVHTYADGSGQVFTCDSLLYERGMTMESGKTYCVEDGTDLGGVTVPEGVKLVIPEGVKAAVSENNLTISSGATLYLNGTLTVTDSDLVQVYGTLYNTGTFAYTGTDEYSFGIVDHEGSVVVNDGSMPVGGYWKHLTYVDEFGKSQTVLAQEFWGEIDYENTVVYLGDGYQWSKAIDRTYTNVTFIFDGSALTQLTGFTTLENVSFYATEGCNIDEGRLELVGQTTVKGDVTVGGGKITFVNGSGVALYIAEDADYSVSSKAKVSYAGSVVKDMDFVGSEDSVKATVVQQKEAILGEGVYYLDPTVKVEHLGINGDVTLVVQGGTDEEEDLYYIETHVGSIRLLEGATLKIVTTDTGDEAGYLDVNEMTGSGTVVVKQSSLNVTSVGEDIAFDISDAFFTTESTINTNKLNALKARNSIVQSANSLEDLANADVDKSVIVEKGGSGSGGKSVVVGESATLPCSFTLAAGDVMTVEAGHTLVVPTGFALTVDEGALLIVEHGGTLELQDDSYVDVYGSVVIEGEFLTGQNAGVCGEGTLARVVANEDGTVTTTIVNLADGTTVTEGYDPKIVEGAGQIYDGKTALTFKSDDEFVNRKNVYVDGEELAEGTDFAWESGSIDVTLLPAFLDTLSAGDHTLEIESTNGKASATFTVPSEDDPEPEDELVDEGSKNKDEVDDKTGSDPMNDDGINNKDDVDNKDVVDKNDAVDNKDVVDNKDAADKNIVVDTNGSTEAASSSGAASVKPVSSDSKVPATADPVFLGSVLLCAAAGSALTLSGVGMRKKTSKHDGK